MGENFNNNTRFRRITFTINNNLDGGQEILYALYQAGIVTYCIMGLETAPKTGHQHLQCYAELAKQKSFKQIKDIFPPKCWFFKSKGSADQNRTYCMKDGNYDEWGTIRKQGSRNDIKLIKQLVDENKSMNEIIENCSSYQQIRIAEKLIQYKKLNIKERIKLEVIYITGPAGSGKTQYALDNCSDNVWLASQKLDWFDGYDLNEDVILNDFRGSWCEYSFLLNLLDGIPLRVPIKGGFTRWKPKRVFITSTIRPHKLYFKDRIEDDSINQLLRRITTYVEMNNFKPTIKKITL